MGSKKRVAILGKSQTWCDAPKNIEWWCLNDTAYMSAKRRFEMHSEERINYLPNYREWLRSLTVPIYMQKRHDDIPMSIKYPLKEIINRFGDHLFTNTICYMVALAIVEEYDELNIFGVDCHHTEDYRNQRPAIVGLLEHAKGLGIKVIVPEVSSLFKKQFLYGYERDPEECALLEIREIVTLLKMLIDEGDLLTQKIVLKLNEALGKDGFKDIEFRLFETKEVELGPRSREIIRLSFEKLDKEKLTEVHRSIYEKFFED